MDGYTSYLSDFQPVPEYSREVLYPHAGSPLSSNYEHAESCRRQSA